MIAGWMRWPEKESRNEGTGAGSVSAAHRCPFPVTSLGLRPRFVTGNPPVSIVPDWRRFNDQPSFQRGIEAVVPSVLQRNGRTAAWRREEDGKREDLSSRNQGIIIVVIREK